MEISSAYSHYFLPISLHNVDVRAIQNQLIEQHFLLYEKETASLVRYGDEIEDNFETLKHYFMPYVSEKIFSCTPENGFQRFSKNSQLHGTLNDLQLSFSIPSIDVIICPFAVAFLVIHVSYDEASKEDLAKAFRQFKEFKIKRSFTIEEKRYTSFEQFLKKELFAHLPYLAKNGVFQRFERFQDGVLLANHFIAASAEATNETLFQLNGGPGAFSLNEQLAPYVSSSYINRYIEEGELIRHSPTIRYIQAEESGVFWTSLSPKSTPYASLRRYFNGPLFYQVMIHYFQKIVLLSFSNAYAKIDWKKDAAFIRSLMKKMTLFEAQYDFRDISALSEEKNVTLLLRQALDLQRIYDEAFHSLQHLYSTQEHLSDIKQNNLLFFLTMSTVISGAFGMNLVIDELKDGVTFSKLASLTFTEVFVLIVTLISVVAAVFFSIYTVSQLMYQTYQKKQRQKNND